MFDFSAERRRAPAALFNVVAAAALMLPCAATAQPAGSAAVTPPPPIAAPPAPIAGPVPVPPAPPAPPRPSSPPPTPEQEKQLIANVRGQTGLEHFCDGYGSPTRSGDGMTKYAFVLGVFAGSGDTSRATPSFANSAVLGYCGAALEELDAKYPDYWLRKVSLLRARAMHRISLGDRAGALKDLDAAEAAAAAHKDDVFYQRSLKLGVDFVRAYALRPTDPVKSRELAMQAWSARPFNRETARAALVVLGHEAAEDDVARVLRSDAQFDPRATGNLFDFEFERGRFAEALALYDGLTPPVQTVIGDARNREIAWKQQLNRVTAAAFWAMEDGRRAYALAALKRNDEARAAITAAEQRLAAASKPGPALAADADEHAKMENAVYEQANLQIRTSIPRVLESWTKLAQARIELNEGKPEAALAALKTPPGSWISVDLAEAVAAADPGAQVQPAALRAQLLARRRPAQLAELHALFEWLPEAETPGRTVGDHRSHWWGSVNGFSVTPPGPGRDYTTVGFRGASSSLTIMEEECLLKAAELAHEQGKAGMVVLGRRDIHHTITTYVYSTPTRTDPAGFETQLDVLFVDPAAPPPAYRNAAWRIIPVDQVRAALGPVYLARESAEASR